MPPVASGRTTGSIARPWTRAGGWNGTSPKLGARSRTRTATSSGALLAMPSFTVSEKVNVPGWTGAVNAARAVNGSSNVIVSPPV